MIRYKHTRGDISETMEFETMAQLLWFMKWQRVDRTIKSLLDAVSS